ncbi:hypothetical protein [Arcobacter sp. F2176]|uniref:hypothetical protein n=1 Tax=Arcobacter sp. F2176 TaxID=2044511 RepID=UPI00100A49CE|nr:hypothetical protein [Arcobacter sp. F2176]RXJ82649.1 hypothetical protein CRU95_00870 [Arcobacter sp. F2176]
MPKFQIQYKYNSKTHTMNLDSDSWQKARDFALTMINGEITDIREFVHEDNRVIKDDKDYVHSKTLTLKNDVGFNSLRIPKIKKSVNDILIQNLVFNHLLINNKKINSIKIATKFN